jgi:hypothetical protein
MDASVVTKVVSYIFKTKKFCCEQVSDVLLYIRLTIMDVFVTVRMSLKPIFAFPKNVVKHQPNLKVATPKAYRM